MGLLRAAGVAGLITHTKDVMLNARSSRLERI